MTISLIQATSGDNFEITKEQKVKEIENEINQLETNFKKILEKFNLNIEQVVKKYKENEEKLVCPYFKNHLVPPQNYEKHCRRCDLIFNGINTKKSLKRPPNSQFFYTKTNVVSIIREGENDTNKNNDSSNIPKNYTENISNENNKLSEYEIIKNDNDSHIMCKVHDNQKNAYELGEKNVNERLEEHINDLALCKQIEQNYLKIKNRLQNVDEIMEIVEEKKAQKEEIEKSKAQLMAEQRDYKRRRKSYRAKNVRITKRNATQIQKDIIDSFMNDYKLFVEIENELKNKKEKRKHKNDHNHSHSHSHSHSHRHK